MVEVRGVTEVRVPHSRVVELQLCSIDEDGEWPARHQLTLHGCLVLVPKHDRMEILKSHAHEFTIV